MAASDVIIHMPDSNSTDSLVEEAAETIGPQAIEAFTLIGNETRVAVLLALWEAFDPFAEVTWDPISGIEGNAVPVSELRERVGVADAGQLDDHLARLEDGYFIEQTSDGYILKPAGTDVVRAVIGNPAFAEASLAPTEVERIHGLAMRASGKCPECSGQVDASLHVCDTHTPGDDGYCPDCGRREEWAVRFICTVCKDTSSTTLSALVAETHHAAAALYWEHGIDLGFFSYDLESYEAIRTIKHGADEELVSRDPPRVCVTIRHNGDELHVTCNEEINVVEVHEGD